MKLNYLFLPCVSHFGKESVIWDMWKWSIRLTVIHFRGNQAHYLPNYFLNCTPLSTIIITNQFFSFSCTIGEGIKKPGGRVPYLRGGFYSRKSPRWHFLQETLHSPSYIDYAMLMTSPKLYVSTAIYVQKEDRNSNWYHFFCFFKHKL